MKRTILIAITLLALLPDVAKSQWTFDIVSVEAYINDHKKQRSLLLARSTLEYSNQLLHEYSREETGKYKEVNIDLDRYTRIAFSLIVSISASDGSMFPCFRIFSWKASSMVL